MEGGNECLCFLSCADWAIGLDGYNWGVGCGCFSSSRTSLWAISGYVPFLVAMEAKSTLNPLALFVVHHGGSCPCMPYVHSIWVAVVKCISPLYFGCAASSFASFDSFS